MDSVVRMDKGDVEMADAEMKVPASDGQVSNESPVKYETSVKTEGLNNESNAEDKTDGESDSKGEDLKQAGGETQDQLNSKSQPEVHGNVVGEDKNSSGVPKNANSDADDAVTPMTADEVQKADKGEVNQVPQSEKMIDEVNHTGDDMMVDRTGDLQMKTNPTPVVTEADARSDEFPKVKVEVIDSSIEKTPEPAVPMLPRKPSTEAGQHSGEASQNISATMAVGEDDEGSAEDQAAFIGELSKFHRERFMEFKPPKFYGQPLNCLKLWRFVTRLGGYDQVTGSKLWRLVGESFNPPKTCTTVSWTFRNFYEKALLQYERHRIQNGELQLPIAPSPGFSAVDNEGGGYQISKTGRIVRDSAARAMLGWHEQRLLYGEVGEPIAKDKSANTPKRAKSLKNTGSLKQKGKTDMEPPVKAAQTETSKQLDVPVVDVGPPADWVKIVVREKKDSFEVYALVPGLLREEVRVQSDPAGRLVITGQPDKPDNLWGITPFKKVVTLPARIDPGGTSAVVSLHGCLHAHVAKYLG